MNFIACEDVSFTYRETLTRMLRMMKLLTVFMFAGFIQVRAVTDIHKVCMNGKIISMKHVLNAVYSIEGNAIVYNHGVNSVQKKAANNLQGNIKDETTGKPLEGASITVKGTTETVVSDVNGNFSLQTNADSGVLVITHISFETKEVAFAGEAPLTIGLKPKEGLGEEVVVIGYGTKKRQDVSSAISTVTDKDIARVRGGATLSTTLAGKIPGVSFRLSDGRPGASANVQIRNFGPALYVIDGVQQDVGAFNNLAQDDIESISVLKDASAAIYGLRAGNGVVVITTKTGKLGSKPVINFNGNYGLQNWTRFPEASNDSYEYMLYKKEALLNDGNITDFNSITQAELDKYKAGTEYGYQSFNWRDFVIKKNAPIATANISVQGGSDKTTYYFSVSHLDQGSAFGKEYKFAKSNIQSNVSTKIANGLKAGMSINGRIEKTDNPGNPGGDDYERARWVIMRNRPMERPYANDNPNYLNDIGHNETNWAYLNYKNSGHFTKTWRVIQTNLTLEYQPNFIKGLTLSGLYSYYFADQVLNNQEYTYDTYTYDPVNKTYTRTGGSTNPWREREQVKQINTTTNIKIDYQRSFGLHTIQATLVNERIKNDYTRNWVHSLPPFNSLSLIYYPDQYQDGQRLQPRIGYIGRVSYGYAGKYNLEVSGRRDGSYLFPPDRRWGNFLSGSASWRITNEKFVQNRLGDNTVLSELKLRASYGSLGDDGGNDNPIVTPFAYLKGYRYDAAGSILGGKYIPGLVDQGIPITNISWIKSNLFDIGIDYNFLQGKITGSIDYFNRKRTGLLDSRRDVVLPAEIGYNLPQENLNSDRQYGLDGSIAYNGNIMKDLQLRVSANGAYSRGMMLDVYRPNIKNSWDEYRNGIANRFKGVTWGLESIGQFKSQEEINNYLVNIDGKGNRTLLPGDLMYKDINGDGKIDDYDLRPIGYAVGGGNQPFINFGFSIGLTYKQLDFTADFSGASGYTWIPQGISAIPFVSEGNLNSIFLDRWRREDPFDPNSSWIPGKYPALRFNPSSGGDGNSNYKYVSTFWVENVTYLRARTIEFGYTLPTLWLSRVKATRARIYANVFNLFSFDNLKNHGVDPEINDNSGQQVPQSRVFNLGVNLSF